MNKKNFKKITRKTKISNQDLEDIYNQYILDKVFRLKEVIIKTILHIDKLNVHYLYKDKTLCLDTRDIHRFLSI